MKSLALTLTALFTLAATLTIAFNANASASPSIEDGSFYCESGDPGGGGPTADITKEGANFNLVIGYNGRDLESSSRTGTFKFDGQATTFISVKEQGADCVRYSFFKPRTKKSVDFTWCEADGFGVVKLKNFTEANPDYEIGCDAL